MLLLYAVAIGLLAGAATRGSLGALANVTIRLWPVALLGLAFQVLLFSSPLAAAVGRLGPSLYVASTTLVLMALVLNIRQPGFWLITLGAVANFTVIVANGGQMPASPEAFAALNGLAVVPTTDFSNSVIAGPNTMLSFLGDNFALPRPLPFANVFSIGDVLIGAGGAWFIARVMHRQTQPAPHARSAPSSTELVAGSRSIRWHASTPRATNA
jgi:uncharacterized protein DUF5317